MPADIAARERRRRDRIPHSEEHAVFRYADQDHRFVLARGHLLNISPTGAAVGVISGPPAETCGLFSVTLPDDTLVVHEARTVRTWSGGFAVEFTDQNVLPHQQLETTCAL